MQSNEVIQFPLEALSPEGSFISVLMLKGFLLPITQCCIVQPHELNKINRKVGKAEDP